MYSNNLGYSLSSGLPGNNRPKNKLSVLPQPSLMALNSILTIGPFKHRKDLIRESVLSKYHIVGYIAAGTYGKVYKAMLKNPNNKEGQDGVNDKEELQLFAIKKFKDESNSSNKATSHDANGNEISHYTGISQSAIREMSLCRELNYKNVINVIDIILENKSIFMVFDYCEHDLLQIIHYHSHSDIKPIPESIVKSLTWQILNGVSYLHQNWVFHRDLKPANIMVTANGVVKVGDLGLARKFNNPVQSLFSGDKVVVTIWYRAPELLLGARHYTVAIDLWAVGCILAEILSLRPIFKGEEAKIDMNNKKTVPFQKKQFQKIVEILGLPNTKIWPSLNKYPEFMSFKQQLNSNYPSNIVNWYKLIGGTNKQCLSLLKGLLEYDPLARLTADKALVHPFFLTGSKVHEHAFEGSDIKYPKRKIYTEDIDIISNQSIKRHAFEEMNNRKRQR